MGEIKEEFIQDVLLYLETYAKAYCHKAADELTRKAKEEINHFYNDYSPKYYVRGDRMKDFSYKRYYKNAGVQRGGQSKAFYGGVRLTAEDIDPSRGYAHSGYGWDKWTVLSSVWFYGYHATLGRRKGQKNDDDNRHWGQITEGAIFTSLSPVDNLRYYMVHELEEECRNVGEKAARTQKYSYLSFNN